MVMPMVNVRSMLVPMCHGFMRVGMRMFTVRRDLPFIMVMGMMAVVVAVTVVVLNGRMNVPVRVLFTQ